MKKLLPTLLACIFYFTTIHAQSCGGVCGCTPNTAIPFPGLTPQPPCLAPIIIDSTYHINVQFKNFDTIYLGNAYIMDSLQIASITNLPTGLCWATNKANNTFANKEDGCIQVSGTVASSTPPGQYRLTIIVTAWLHGFPGGITIDAGAHFFYFIRVVNYGDSCAHLVDTTTQHIAADSVLLYTPGVCPVTGIQCISSPIYMSIAQQNEACHGQSNGSALALISGGGTTYTYSWSNGASSDSIGGLAVGPYSVTVVSDLGVIATASINISQPLALAITLSATQPTCADTAGSLSATVTGGTGAYTYGWSNGGNSPGLPTASSGSYSLTVHDANGCSDTANAVINPGGFSITTQPANTSVSAGATLSFATASGNPSVTYQWQSSSGGAYTDLSNSGIFSGVTTNFLTLTGVTSNYNGYSFRCVLSDSLCSDTTHVASLTVVAGIDELPAGNVTVFPNPSFRTLFVSTNSWQPLKTVIYDINGQKLMEQKYSPVIDLSDLSTGVYFIELKDNNYTLRKRFVKIGE